MTRSELTDAIAIPAQKLNVQFQAGLIDAILNEFPSGDYSLPLLEFALTQLWSKQENGWLTHRAYQEIGGINRAIANYADSLYHQFNPREQEKVRQILVQLVQFGENIPLTRRLAKCSEIRGNDGELIDRLADARLIVTNWNDENREETIELIHEALIEYWQKFKYWLDEARSFRGWQEQLRVTISQWEDSNRDEEGLLRGKAINTAVDWLTIELTQISPTEQEFINLSLAKPEGVTSTP
jgi:hypothetical protein